VKGTIGSIGRAFFSTEAKSSQRRPMLADRSRMDVPVCKLLSRGLDGVSLAYIDTYMNSVVVMNNFHGRSNVSI
jgi:hypothetical protein